MTYLAAIPKERATDGKWTTVREPVVPCFPSMHAGAFLAVPSFTLAEKAEVVDIGSVVSGFDPGEMMKALAKEYPGLPEKLHENYILKTWEAVRSMDPGRVFKVIVNQKQALLIDDRTGETVMLWQEQPLS